MQQIIAFGEIKRRALRIGVTLRQLAEDTGLDPSTAYRAARGGDVRVSTAAKLAEALIAREAALLNELAALHPGMVSDLLRRAAA